MHRAARGGKLRVMKRAIPYPPLLFGLLLLLAVDRRAAAEPAQVALAAFGAQVAAGLFYALARYRRETLWLVIVCLGLNWLGDSLDGTLARVRRQPRPRFGFYVDHMVDVLGSIAMMTGLAFSGLVHPGVAMGMLIAFLALACESYLATYTVGRFELSQGLFGPTEIRLLLVLGNLKLLHNPWVTVLHHRVLLFDIGGTIGVAGMALVALVTMARHTAQLYREEPLLDREKPMS